MLRLYLQTVYRILLASQKLQNKSTGRNFELIKDPQISYRQNYRGHINGPIHPKDKLCKKTAR